MLVTQIELVLLVTGVMTAGAMIVFLAPATTMKLAFEQAPADWLSLLIIRHWGLLIFLVGALLVCASHHPEIRTQVLMVAIVEKVVFALGVFVSPIRRRPAAAVMALADSSMAAIFALYLSSR